MNILYVLALYAWLCLVNTRNTVCSPRRTCQAGQYFGCSVCTNCKPGMYGTNGRFCHTCADGTFSTGGATYCAPVRTTCPYGQWKSAGALPGRVGDITCSNCIEADTKCGTSGGGIAQPTHELSSEILSIYWNRVPRQGNHTKNEENHGWHFQCTQTINIST